MSKSYLKRSKSLCSLSGYKACPLPNSRDDSGSSGEYVVNYEESDTSVDSGEVLVALEQKVDRLSDLFLEQCRLLKEMRKEIRSSKTLIEKSEQAQNLFIAELLKSALAQKPSYSNSTDVESSSNEESFNSRARSLLDAIEAKRTFCLEREIRDALVDFLQSEDLKQHMVSATVEAMRDLVQGSVSRDVSRVYVPLLQRSQRRLAGHVTRALEYAFQELEEHSASFSSAVYNSSRGLRRALERHQWLLEEAGRSKVNLQCTVEEVLQQEMRLWRQQALEALFTQPPLLEQERDEEEIEREESPPPSEYGPLSPTQPADPQSSIDQLMMSAEINKQIQDGDVNGSFEKALSAADLYIVMVACRAADPVKVFAPPCQLEQSVLLSLVQQLVTDMVHDTQLKCRYIEEALLNLNTTNPATRAHLPLVVGEVRKNLTYFLTKFPNHVACTRVMLIIMAADNLLK